MGLIELRDRVAPDFLKQLDRADERVSEVLTPRQKGKWRTMTERWRRLLLQPDLQKTSSSGR